MAFIDFSQTADPVLSGTATRANTAPASSPEEFSALEWRVLELSRQDGLETLKPQPKRSWFARLLLGPPPPNRTLANERLEALRRLAVEARHRGWLVRPSAIAAARLAGFTEAQIERVLDVVDQVPTLAQRNFA